MARELGAAVVGLGVGEAHARTYAELSETTLVAVHDLDADRAAAVASELGARVAPTFDELLRDPAIDVVSIASYDDAHFEQVVSALRAGKHVFVEKPLCRTLDEARAVKAAWEAGGRRGLGSNLVLRAAPLYAELRRLVGAGSLGRLYAFDGDYLYGRLHKITDGWRRDVPDYSVMLGGGVHLVDLMLWLTGERPRVAAAVGNRIATSGTAFRYNDFVAATFSFDSGLIGRVTANFGSVHRHQHVIRIFGTEATALYDDAGPRLHRSRDPEAAAEPMPFAALPDTKGALLPEFVRALARGDDPAPTAQHELDVIAVCAAADLALAQGESVDIEYA